MSLTTFSSERSVGHPPRPAGLSPHPYPRTRRWTAVVDQYSDDELVARYQDGDGDALTALLRRYRSLARAKARAYFLAGGDADDIEQEGMIGLVKAARSFRPDRRASFVTFAQLCVNAQVLTAVKTASRKKHRPLSQYVSISDHQTRSIGGERAVEQLLGGHHHPDPADEVVAAAQLAAMRRQVARCLSGFELDVLSMYLEGMTYREIGEQLGRPAKAIDNALQRIKRKLDTCLGCQ